MSILTYILNNFASKKSFYLPAGMTVTGTFTVDVPGQIAGSVNGNVFVNGTLGILKNAVITGNVKAETLEIFGTVIGDIQCSGKMILHNTCYVKGNISTVEIHIEKNAVIDGMITKPVSNTTDFEPAFATGEPVLIEETIEDSPADIIAEPVIIPEEPVIVKMEEEEAQSWF
ncbi:MAG: polymer-forming cytoskeletal protein [Ferruginibacter sp.]|nr:polymer-forming cytoskeletal protein [Ferruginibacter sp.]